MLAQVLSVQAAETKVIDQERTQPSQLRKEDIAGATAIVLCVLDLDSARRAKFSTAFETSQSSGPYRTSVMADSR